MGFSNAVESSCIHGPRKPCACRRSLVPGLFDAVLSGKVQTNYSPGLEFLDDKQFTTYVDDLVRFYLGEEPILQNVPTRRFVSYDASGQARVDRDALAEVMANKDMYVLKIVDGRGGDGVWVGPKTKASDWLKLRARVLANPEAFIAQEYKHLSVLGDRIVDLRLLSMVDENGRVIVAGTPWGRSIPLSGDGKVNISKQGQETVVVVVPDPPR